MLNTHTALVTGATQGIGLAIARKLANAGAQVIVHGIEPVEQGQAVAAELAAQTGVRTAYVRADLADEVQAAGLFEAATASPGRARHPGQQRRHPAHLPGGSIPGARSGTPSWPSTCRRPSTP